MADGCTTVDEFQGLARTYHACRNPWANRFCLPIYIKQQIRFLKEVAKVSINHFIHPPLDVKTNIQVPTKSTINPFVPNFHNDFFVNLILMSLMYSHNYKCIERRRDTNIVSYKKRMWDGFVAHMVF